MDAATTVSRGAAHVFIHLELEFSSATEAGEPSRVQEHSMVLPSTRMEQEKKKPKPQYGLHVHLYCRGVLCTTYQPPLTVFYSRESIHVQIQTCVQTSIRAGRRKTAFVRRSHQDGTSRHSERTYTPGLLLPRPSFQTGLTTYLTHSPIRVCRLLLPVSRQQPLGLPVLSVTLPVPLRSLGGSR